MPWLRHGPNPYSHYSYYCHYSYYSYYCHYSYYSYYCHYKKNEGAAVLPVTPS